MNRDSRLMFEAYETKLKESHSTEAEIEKLLNYLRQDYTEGRGLDNETLGDVIHEIEDIIRSSSPTGGQEDAEDDIMAKIEQKRKERKNIGSVRTTNS